RHRAQTLSDTFKRYLREAPKKPTSQTRETPSTDTRQGARMVLTGAIRPVIVAESRDRRFAGDPGKDGKRTPTNSTRSDQPSCGSRPVRSGSSIHQWPQVHADAQALPTPTCGPRIWWVDWIPS